MNTRQKQLHKILAKHGVQAQYTEYLIVQEGVSIWSHGITFDDVSEVSPKALIDVKAWAEPLGLYKTTRTYASRQRSNPNVADIEQTIVLDTTGIVHYMLLCLAEDDTLFTMHSICNTLSEEANSVRAKKYLVKNNLQKVSPRDGWSKESDEGFIKYSRVLTNP